MARVVGKGGIDYPDFHVRQIVHNAPVSIDVAELSVRLGSTHRFEQTGNVLFIEDWDCGLSSWVVGGYPIACYPILDASYHYIKPYACKLLTDGTAGANSFIKRDIPFPYVTSLGMQFSFLARSDFNYLEAQLHIYTGELHYYFQTQIDITNKCIEIYAHPGTNYNVYDYTIELAGTSDWHTVKIVGDFINRQYVRGLIDGADFDLSDYALRVTEDDTNPVMRLYFLIYEPNEQADAVWLDNIILTLNEPT